MKGFWKDYKELIIAFSLIVLMILMMPVAVFHLKTYSDEQKILHARKYDENDCIIWDDGRGPCWQSDVYDSERLWEVLSILEEDTIPFILESADIASEEITKAMKDPVGYFRDFYGK